MSTKTGRTAEEVMYKELKYIAVNPLEPNVHCLDVVTKVGKPLLERVRSNLSSKMSKFVIVGSMLDVNLMAEKSKWRSADHADVASMRKGLADLEHPLKRPSHRKFQKTTLEKLDLSFAVSKKGVVWLASIAGIELGKEDNLSCSLEGLTAASVDYMTICDWINAGDWFPNLPLLEMTFSDFSKNVRSKVKKLWIVTEVLYATKVTVTGRRGLFDKVMANASASVPGVAVNLSADIGVNFINGTTLEMKAKRNKQFIVGYRTMRVEIGPDGKPTLFRKAEDGGLRGDDDDYLEAMREDIFESDENGGEDFIPLWTPTDQELRELCTLESHFSGLNSGDLQAV